ncbi:MAG: YncE family protein [Planctomycetes bacterium]|nr:YncE family protein [Planctomycetota bacterium]
MRIHSLTSLALTGLLSASALAQHSQVSSVAVDPANPQRVWVCNRDNNTVSLVDVGTASVVAEIGVGVNPRSLALSPDGAKLFVVNQRGDVPLSANSVTGFPANAARGTVSVIDTGTLAVSSTLTGVGVEPYGLAMAPNGKFFAVTAFRSGTVKLFRTSTQAQMASLQYDNNLSMLPVGVTVADADANHDGIADLGEPRGFVIRSDSARMYVTHNRSPYVSVLDIALDGTGSPTGITLAGKIDLNEYPYDPFYNPTKVQVLQSQGLPRFLEDIALSPDGTRALVPHVLHNINHDVTHSFGPALAGDFANRVYPALTEIDTAADSYAQPGDASRRLHHELSDTLTPEGFASYGDAHVMANGNAVVLGGVGHPVLGGTLEFTVEGMNPGDTAQIVIGSFPVDVPAGAAGHVYVKQRFVFSPATNRLQIPIPNSAHLGGAVLVAQAIVTDGTTSEVGFSNGVRFRIGSSATAANVLGYRAGQPSRVLYNASGDHALMLNRGSEDLFLFEVNGSDLTLATVWPERIQFQERAPLDTTTPMGDLPLGMAMVEDLSTVNDDALLYVINEGTRTLSALRVDFGANAIVKVADQIPTVTGADVFTQSQIVGQELFEDASRAQTTGNFNNSCASCHFEGGGDGNVWQRPAGPRSTMPVYGGSLGTGLILWKGVRLNMGETGPMFGGENGGNGQLTDAQQKGLTDYHEVISPPLNPNLDANGNLTATAAFGRDLFFGTNDTGLNPTNRTANCFECHKNVETNPNSNPGPRFFTADFVHPLLMDEANLQALDPDCFSLQENIVALNIRTVNSGCNVDIDHNGQPDIDRNGDGYDDRESYAIMNADTNDDFRRDDGNSYMCPCDPLLDPNCDAQNPTRLFTRQMTHFSIPTKLGVYSTGPYFHDHSALSLRNLLDPDSQMFGTQYGSPAHVAAGHSASPTLFKLYNDVHDVRGHEQFFQGISKVQQTLASTNADADIEALLAFIQSL